MQILKTIKNTGQRVLPKDLINTTTLLKDAIQTGWQNGKKCSTIDNKGMCQDLFTRTKYVAKEIKSLKIDKENIPVFAAAIAYIAPIPIPGLTLYTYAIAKGIAVATKFIKKLIPNRME